MAAHRQAIAGGKRCKRTVRGVPLIPYQDKDGPLRQLSSLIHSIDARIGLLPMEQVRGDLGMVFASLWTNRPHECCPPDSLSSFSSIGPRCSPPPGLDL